MDAVPHSDVVDDVDETGLGEEVAEVAAAAAGRDSLLPDRLLFRLKKPPCRNSFRQLFSSDCLQIVFY